MGKIYAPFGYIIDNDGKDYYDSDDKKDLLKGALRLADWEDDIREHILNLKEDELIRLFLENGFEIEGEK